MTNNRRPDYYEDDAVYYSCRGTHPIMPERYKRHKIYIRHKAHILNSYFSEKSARVAFSRASKGYTQGFVIFRCPICGFWHILQEKAYNQFMEEQGLPTKPLENDFDDFDYNDYEFESMLNIVGKEIANRGEKTYSEGIEIGKQIGFEEAKHQCKLWLEKNWRKYVDLDSDLMIGFHFWKSDFDKEIQFENEK